MTRHQSVIDRTGQRWKWLSAQAMLIVGGFVMFFGINKLDAEGAYFGVAMFGLLLAICALLFGWLAIRCPACGSRWVWVAMSTQKPGNWLVWLEQQTVCPSCRKPESNGAA